MELKTYIEAFKKYIVFIIALTIMGGILAFFITSNFKPGYSLSQTFFISPPNISQETSAEDPNYFAQEKARNFTDTAVAIIDSQDFKSTVLNGSQSLSVRKLSPQVIRLTVVSTSSSDATRLMQQIPTQFNSKLSTLQPDSPIFIKEIAPAPQPALVKADRRIFTVAGLILGFAFAFFALSLKFYIKT